MRAIDKGGGRQLRANGVSGMQEVSQHASGWVLIESGIECRLTGEILPVSAKIWIFHQLFLNTLVSSLVKSGKWTEEIC